MSFTPAEKKKLMAIPGMRELKEEFEKKTKGAGGNIKSLKGSGWWDAVKKNVGDINDFLKKYKVISRAGKVAAGILAFTPLAEASPFVAGASMITDGLGYGKRTGKKSIKGGKKLVRPPPMRPTLGMGTKPVKGKGSSTAFNTVSTSGDKVKF